VGKAAAPGTQGIRQEKSGIGWNREVAPGEAYLINRIQFGATDRGEEESGHREAADSGIVDHLKEASTAAPELPERTRPSPSIHTPTATRTGRYPGHAPPGETRDIYKDVQPATVLIRCGSAVVKTRMVITRCSVWKLRITVDARSVTLSQRVRRGTALLRPS
jgi:hypothetical protein